VFPYDDTAATVIRAAGDEANRLGTPGYDTCQVLLALLQTRDPVTRRVTEADPRITVKAVRDHLHSAGDTPAAGDGTSPATAVPAAEFREATTRFTAKWRPLVRGPAAAARAQHWRRTEATRCRPANSHGKRQTPSRAH
jgi:hypothetical protein